MSAQSDPHLHNEDAARRRLEKILWPHGAVCPRCGGLDRITKVKGGRAGLYRCGPCKRQFTVTVGTLFERSHVPLHLWFQAAHLMTASKKGFSAHQLHRVLGVTYKTAWFMAHRIREAMRSGALAPMGGLSEESALKRPSRKISTACSEFGVQHLNLWQMLRKEFPNEPWSEE